jgi:hypothetical protein
MTKSEFLKTYKLTEGQFNGTEKINGNLYLPSLTSIPEGFNPTVGGYLNLPSLTSIPEGFNPTVGGYLYLPSLTSIPEGFNPTVGVSLDLPSLTSIPEGFNPTVGGSLDLRSLTSIPEGFNPTVGGNLYLPSLTSIPEGFNPTVGGYLNLYSLTSIPEGFNPTVGGNLYLYSLTSIPEGFNPTVGGNLYLYSLTSIPEGFNPTVGGNLNLRSGMKCDYTPLGNKIISWQNGKYIKVDGIFCEVISHKGNVWKCKSLNKDNVFYVISDGNGVYSHGASIKEAREDLIYKLSDNIDKSKYEGITLDTKFTFKEAIECYRVLTGACSFGTRHFVESNNISKRKKYTVKSILELTKGQYGYETFKDWVTG